jgi:hypothetical protein
VHSPRAPRGGENPPGTSEQACEAQALHDLSLGLMRVSLLLISEGKSAQLSEREEYRLCDQDQMRLDIHQASATDCLADC